MIQAVTFLQGHGNWPFVLHAKITHPGKNHAVYGIMRMGFFKKKNEFWAGRKDVVKSENSEGTGDYQNALTRRPCCRDAIGQNVVT